MGKFSKLISRFNKGELAPELQGASDIESYNQSAHTVENVIITRSGTAIKRPGMYMGYDLSQFANYVDNNSFQLYPYTSSDGLTSAIVLSRRSSGGNSLEGKVISLISSNEGGLSTTNMDFEGGVSGTLSSNTLPNDLSQHVQVGDVVILATPGFNSQTRVRPYILEGTGVNSINRWPTRQSTAIATKDYQSFPYLDENITSTTLTPSATTGSITITSSTALFDPLHVGTFFQITHAGTTGVAEITGWTSSTVVSATVVVNFGATSASTSWREAAWSDYRGWPRTVTYHENRLVFGGTFSYPDTVWGSLVGNIYHFMSHKLAQDAGGTDVSGDNWFGAAADTDPYAFTLSSGEVSDIRWLVGANKLHVGTEGAEYSGDGGSTIISNSSVSFTAETSHGSDFVQAFKVGNNTMFVGLGGQRILEYSYEFNTARGLANDLTLSSGHISSHGFEATGAGTFQGATIKFDRLAWDKSNSILWCLTSGNKITGLTYAPEVGTVAWHKHSIGNGIGLGDYVDVQSIAACNVQATGGTTLFAVVRRADADQGNETRITHTLEYMTEIYDKASLVPDDIKLSNNPCYLDGATYDLNSPTALPAGTYDTSSDARYDHFESLGEFQSVLDGRLQPTTNGITSGNRDMTLDYSVNKLLNGFPYTSTLRLNRIEAGSDFGSAQGLQTRPDRALITFRRTVNGKLGYSVVIPPDYETFVDTVEEIPFVPSNVAMGEAMPLFTGTMEVYLKWVSDTDALVVFLHDTPFPFTISSINLRGQTNGAG